MSSATNAAARKGAQKSAKRADSPPRSSGLSARYPSCPVEVEGPRGRLTEIDAVKALETFRRESHAMKDISFPTIAGAGPNSAIPIIASASRPIEGSSTAFLRRVNELRRLR